MHDNSKTFRSSTTTRSWSSTTDLTPEQRKHVEALLDGQMDGATVSEQWSYSGTENGATFTVDIKDGVVTVNGRRFESMDEVPRADREHIEALRNGQGMEGLWAMLRNAGMDVESLDGAAAGHQSRPAFTIETDTTGAVVGAPAPGAYRAPGQGTQADSAPGAVPAGGGLRRTLLIGIAIGLALWVAQALNLF